MGMRLLLGYGRFCFFWVRDRRTLLDKFVQLLLSLTGALEGPLLLVVDAESASA